MPLLTELNLYPIKSCAGISLREATLTPAGLMSQQIYDREWMVVDMQGQFLSQREYPKMALITPRIKADVLELRAPGMLRLEIPLDLADPDEAPSLSVTVWDDTVKAYDCNDVIAAWFSNTLGVPCRLARFHPHASRAASVTWAGKVPAPTFFADGFPLLVISEGSLADLNQKLAEHGRSALPMNRFRPNIVINGTPAFDEDFAASLRIGEALLQPVKPCTRCSIPAIDQANGVIGPDPADILQTYRKNPRLDDGVTFGMNAVMVEGEGTVLRVGQEVELTLAL